MAARTEGSIICREAVPAKEHCIATIRIKDKTVVWIRRGAEQTCNALPVFASRATLKHLHTGDYGKQH